MSNTRELIVAVAKGDIPKGLDKFKWRWSPEGIARIKAVWPTDGYGFIGEDATDAYFQKITHGGPVVVKVALP